MNRSFRRIVKHKRPKLQVRNPGLAPVLDLFESDEKMTYLIGWPGYRNTRNRSGLGYIETRAEWAHMQGRLLRLLFTGRFRSRDPLTLFGAALGGLFLGGIPLVLILAEFLLAKDPLALCMIPLVAPGLALLINVGLSVLPWESKAAERHRLDWDS